MNINVPRPGRGLALPFTKAANTKASLPDSEIRLPLIHKVPDVIRNHFIAMSGEFVGTTLFLFFALSGTQVANNIPSSAGLTVAQTGSNPAQLQYISLCFGFSLAVNAWVFFRISGGLFNPAVTVGMALIGALPWIRGALLIFVQILGGITAAALVACMFPGNLTVQTTLGGGTSVVQGLFIEMILTAQLVFTIFMLAAEKHKGTFIAPVGIGLSLFVAELTGVYFTGGSLNPARTFGPDVVLHNFKHYHWIYWVGPLLGSIVAAGFYKFIKSLEYETANPGQDSSHAQKVKDRKDLLVAAGINETDAHHVAHELTAKHAAAEAGGPDGSIVANGQGSTSIDDVEKTGGMYGTRFRGSTTRVAEEPEDVKDVVSPGVTSTLSSPGEHRYLGNIARHGSQTSATQRLESPAMITQDELYKPLAEGGSEPLGGLVNRR